MKSNEFKANMIKLSIPKVRYIANQEIVVVIADLRNLATEKLVETSLLTKDELDRCHRFLQASDKNMFVAGRSILRSVIHSYSDIPVTNIELDFVSGKPVLPDPHRSLIHFNITHSNDVVMVAFHPNFPVGIDVERYNSNIDLTAVAKTIMSNKEFNYFSNFSGKEQLNHFYQTWVAKESILKCMGTGFYFDPKKINPNEFISKNGIEHLCLNHNDYIVLRYNFDNDYPWAVSVKSKPDNFVINKHLVSIEYA